MNRVMIKEIIGYKLDSTSIRIHLKIQYIIFGMKYIQPTINPL